MSSINHGNDLQSKQTDSYLNQGEASSFDSGVGKGKMANVNAVFLVIIGTRTLVSDLLGLLSAT